MSQSERPRRFHATTIVLHGLMALGIIVAFGMGAYMTELAFSPTRLKLYNWHKWLGITLLGLAALRLLTRLAFKAPAAAAGPRWQQMASHAVHALLYVCFFAIPLSGWAYSSAAGFPIVWLGHFPLPDLVSPDHDLAEQLKEVHELLTKGLLALVLLHVGAALKHQLVDKDGLLRRMSLRSK